MDDTDTGASFADLLAGAAHPARAQRSTAATIRPTRDQSSADKTQQGATMTQESSTRRTLRKPDKTKNTNDPAQPGPDATLVSLSAAGATTQPEPTVDPESAAISDEAETSVGTVETSPVLLQLQADSQKTPIAPANDPLDPDSTDLKTSAPPPLATTRDLDNPIATTVKESVVPSEALPPAPKPASKARPSAASAPTSSRRSASSDDSDLSSSSSNASSPSAAVAPLAAATGSSLSRAEKNAPLRLPSANGQAADSVSTQHDGTSDAQLTSASQQVKHQSAVVGISSAEPSADMRKPASTSPIVQLDRTSGVDASAGTMVSTALSSAPGSASAKRVIAEPASTPISHAATAIEATLDAVERSRDIAHSSVELKLSFGDDTRLSVRVELRNGAIQATFRTDSTELRQALANGWRQQAPSVVATASDQSLRIADPIFASGSGLLDSAGTSTGGQADSRQSPASASAESSFATPRSPQLQASPVASLPSSPLRLPTSLRLNVFA